VTTLGLIAAVVLGASFVLAGASKLAAGRLWPQQARDLGAPEWTIAVLPWVELVLGALLVVQLGRPWSALAALGLLGAFTGLILVRLSEGRRPACACFGAWSAKPLGAGHVVRNLVLIAIGVVALTA
jgi:uncharacterized membrane protein YphA (DoxX/SURF4 family)